MRPECPHRPPCPGCPRFGEPDIALDAAAALATLARQHGIHAVPMIGGSTFGFRLRARLAIRGRVGSPKIGLFEADSHRVVHIPNCSVHHPLINRVAAIVRRAIAETRLSCYSDRAHLGLLRYLQVVVERSSQTAQVVLVANCEGREPLEPLFALIAERLGAELHSLWFNANGTASNTILGPDFHRWSGPESVVERFAGAAVHYPPGAFGQNNLEIADRIVAHVGSLVPAGARVAEFYAGVGAIGLSLASKVGELRMNEISAESLRGLELGLAQLETSTRAKCSVLAGAAGAAHAAAKDVDIVIADPPRKGLDAELTAYLSEHPPQRLVYVSCGLESLLEDSRALTARGKLRLAALQAFNLMPFTEHVETVACFERSAS